jgi:hypothetical protein
MRNYFEATVTYAKENENGLLKKVSEKYLVDSLSHTEAEARIYDLLSSNRPDFHLKRLVPSKISEVFFYEGNFYKCKVSYSSLDDSGKGKKITEYVLIGAENIKDAYDRVSECLKSTLVHFDLPKIELSPIIEVFNHEEV